MPDQPEERSIRIATQDGETLAAVCACPAGAGRAPVVMMCHGIFSGKNSKTNLSFAGPLRSAGIATLRFDFRGHYESTGRIEDFTLGAALLDLDAVMDFVRRSPEFDPERVALLGTSFGGNTAVLWAAGRRDLRAIALKSPCSDYAEVRDLDLGPEGIRAWRDSGITIIDGFPSGYGCYEDARARDTYAAARRLQTPCLIVHGEADTLVPVSQSRKLDRALACEHRLVVLPGADHLYSDPSSFDSMVAQITAWLTGRLAAGPAGPGPA